MRSQISGPWHERLVGECSTRTAAATLPTSTFYRDAVRARFEQSALTELQGRASTSQNLLPLRSRQASKPTPPPGEISDAIRRLFEEYQESVVV